MNTTGMKLHYIGVTLIVIGVTLLAVCHFTIVGLFNPPLIAALVCVVGGIFLEVRHLKKRSKY